MTSQVLHLNTSFTKNRRLYNNKLLGFVLRLKKTLQISSEEIQDVLHFSHHEYDDFLSGKNELSVLRFGSLASQYKFSLDAFVHDKIDFETLRQHHLGNSLYLPEKYTVGAYSKKQLLITVLDYVEKYHGWNLLENIRTYFQLNNSIHSDPQGAINVYLFEDILNYLLNYGLTDQNISEIGYHSVQTTQKTKFAIELSQYQTPKEMYERYLSDLIKLVERNNNYELIKLTDTYCEVKTTEIQDRLDKFKTHHIGGPKRCLYRAGALEAATNYIGFPYGQVDETKCVHRGDPHCIYHIQYNNWHHSYGQKELIQ